jgi:acetyl esterase/lipase
MSVSCGAYYWAGIRLYYRQADLAASQVRRDIPYAGPTSTAKQRLNLFIPAPTAGRHTVPFVMFVHGGNWDEGDRNFEVGGADVYNNIGRYLASHGIGAAVISYRLLPEVTWQGQIADVAAAVQWVGAHAREYGGSANCVFVMGHSAGAQLAARVALDPDVRGADGEPMPSICGVIGVSGAGYDLADQRTYELSGDLDWYAARFGTVPDWQRSASPIRFVRTASTGRIPPFLLLYAGGEGQALQRQSQLMHETLLKTGASSSLVVAPGESHSRIVLTLSRDDKTAGPAVVKFVKDPRKPDTDASMRRSTDQFPERSRTSLHQAFVPTGGVRGQCKPSPGRSCQKAVPARR